MALHRYGSQKKRKHKGHTIYKIANFNNRMLNISHDNSNTSEARKNYGHADKESQISQSIYIQNYSKLQAEIAEFLAENYNRRLQFKDEENPEIPRDLEEIAVASIPRVQDINVCENSTFHFGSQFLSVDESFFTEEFKDAEEIEKVPRRNNSIRCSFIIFVCCSLIVGSGMAHFYISNDIKMQRVIDLGIHEWWYFRRVDWQAMPRINKTLLILPIRYVIIGHSGTDSCEGKGDCIEELQVMQYNDRHNKSYHDVGPNFIITREGFVFEGRGANVRSKMVEYYDSKSITIQFLGDYRTTTTVPAQFRHLNVLLTELVKKEVLVRNYQIVGHCQLNPEVKSPGVNIMYDLGSLAHWWPNNSIDCIKI